MDSRGSALAAPIMPPITLPISAGSRPSRSSSWYSKPPLVESPMIGGRLNGNTIAERICCAAPNTRPITACARSAAAVRSANGLSRTTTNAALLCAARSSSEKPTMESTRCTCGSLCSMSSTRAVTARVRATEAASGSCTATKNAPWSSSGRKPVGVRRPNQAMPPPATATSSSDTRGQPQQPPHDRGVAVAHGVDAAQHRGP